MAKCDDCIHSEVCEKEIKGVVKLKEVIEGASEQAGKAVEGEIQHKEKITTVAIDTILRRIIYLISQYQNNYRSYPRYVVMPIWVGESLRFCSNYILKQSDGKDYCMGMEIVPTPTKSDWSEIEVL